MEQLIYLKTWEISNLKADLKRWLRYHTLLFNFTQQNTNNAKNEYKYLTVFVFVLQGTSLTGLNLRTSNMAENTMFSQKKK